MRELYPEIQANHDFYFDAGDGYQLYVAEYGNPQGVPVFVLHGGPGVGCEQAHARYFDPEYYRIILHDQRGAGRSTPKASLQNNNSAALISDIENLRQHMCAEQRILVFGGSWGATLALLYAEQYPAAVAGLVLRGVFLGRSDDVEALLSEASTAAQQYPEQWRAFKQTIMGDATQTYAFTDILDTSYTQILDEQQWRIAGRAYADWEDAIAYYTGQAGSDAYQEWAARDDNGAGVGRLVVYYSKQGFFIAENQILQQIDKLKSIPTFIVHGEFDYVCAYTQAQNLYEALCQAGNNQVSLRIVAAGHSVSEVANIDQLVQATDAFAQTGNFTVKTTDST